MEDSKRAAHRGVHVIATNHDLPEVWELYSDPIFRFKTGGVNRTINIKSDSRGKVQELIIYTEHDK